MKIPEELDLEKNVKVERLEKKQRYLERGLREWKRKAVLFKSSNNQKEYAKAKGKCSEWSKRINDHTKVNDLKRDHLRERTVKSLDYEKEFKKLVKSEKPDVILEDGYQNKNHSQEIKIADWIKEEFHAEVKLLKEDYSKPYNVDSFISNKVYCEFKDVSSERSIDNQFRKGIKQVYYSASNSTYKAGAILLNITSDMDFDTAYKKLLRVAKERVEYPIIAILKKNDLYKMIYFNRQK